MTVTATIHTPPPDPVPDRRVVTLTMPYDVAVTLRALVGKCVYGEPKGSYREHTDQLFKALKDAGVAPDGTVPRFVDTVEAKPLTK